MSISSDNKSAHERAHVGFFSFLLLSLITRADTVSQQRELGILFRYFIRDGNEQLLLLFYKIRGRCGTAHL